MEPGGTGGMSLSAAAIDETPEERDRRVAGQICQYIDDARRAYMGSESEGRADVRCSKLLTSQFWQTPSDGLAYGDEEGRPPQSIRDEIYPLFDAIASGLAMSNPQLAAIDQREGNMTTAEYEAANRFARTMSMVSTWSNAGNEWQKMARAALTFARGGMMIVEPDSELGCPRVTALRQHEFLMATDGGSVEKATWAVRILRVSAKEWRARFKSGYYAVPPDVVVEPDTLLATDAMFKGTTASTEQRAIVAEAALFPRYTVYEWYDFENNTLAHLSATRQCFLMKVALPYGNPFIGAILDPVTDNETRQVSAVYRWSNPQLWLNVLQNTANRVAASNYDRTIIDKRVGGGDDDFAEKFRKMGPDEAVDADVAGDIPLDKLVHVVKVAGLTDSHVRVMTDLVEFLRYLAGADQFRDRANVRTAEEVAAMQQSRAARVAMRVDRIDTAILRMFAVINRVLLWMIDNAAQLQGFNPEKLFKATQKDIDFAAWVDILRAGSDRLNLSPYSALKEDAMARQKALAGLVGMLANPAITPRIDLDLLLREYTRAGHLPPALVVRPEPAPTAAPGMPGTPPGMPTPAPESTVPDTAAPPLELPEGIVPDELNAATQGARLLQPPNPPAA